MIVAISLVVPNLIGDESFVRTQGIYICIGEEAKVVAKVRPKDLRLWWFLHLMAHRQVQSKLKLFFAVVTKIIDALQLEGLFKQGHNVFRSFVEVVNLTNVPCSKPCPTRSHEKDKVGSLIFFLFV